MRANRIGSEQAAFEFFNAAGVVADVRADGGTVLSLNRVKGNGVEGWRAVGLQEWLQWHSALSGRYLGCPAAVKSAN